MSYTFFFYKVHLSYKDLITLLLLKGMKQTTAEYWLIKEVSNLQNFGEEVFEGRTSNGSSVLLGVGPHGISLEHSDQSDHEKQM